MRQWLVLGRGPLVWKLHVLLPVVVAAAFVFGRPGLGLRYLLLLAALLLHETAHAVVARRQGARVELRVWPFFAAAFVEKRPPRERIRVALAAPLLNLLIAGTTWLLGGRFSLALGSCPLSDLWFTAHAAMGTLNLFPIEPLDGGRALAAWAEMRRGDEEG